jgi:hypothetical protein
MYDERVNIKFFLYLILGVLVITGIFYLVSLLINFFPKQETTVDTSRTAVIQEIKKLNRLETAQFNIEKVIEAGKDTDNEFSTGCIGRRANYNYESSRSRDLGFNY